MHGALGGMFGVQPLWGVICQGLYPRATENYGAEFRKWAHRTIAFTEAFGSLLRKLFAHKAGRDTVLMVGIKQAAQPILRTLFPRTARVLI
jgi:hypothetical protein